MRFVGMLGPEGESPDRDDVLYFRDGQFWSQNCVKCGFQPGAYFARRAKGGIEFQGVLESAERGRFSYSGIVRDGRIAARMRWQKKRWYWSIDKMFIFEGTLDAGHEIGTPGEAAVLAAAARPGVADCRL